VRGQALEPQGTGRWGSSVGERAKFGLSVPDCLATLDTAAVQADRLGELRLLHSTGSQINRHRRAQRTPCRKPVRLRQSGPVVLPLGYLDVGGGLGIDYDAAGTGPTARLHQLLAAELRHDVVATVRESAKPLTGIPLPPGERERPCDRQPFQFVLVFDVLVRQVSGGGAAASEAPPLIVRNLRDSPLAIEAGAERQQRRPTARGLNDAIPQSSTKRPLAASVSAYLTAHRAGAREAPLSWASANRIAASWPAAGQRATPMSCAALPGAPGQQPTTVQTLLRCFRSAPTPGD